MPPTSPRERLIEAARRLFCRYGVNSVGVDAIVEAAGTAKTTLYKLFGSKDGLVEAVLECEGRAWRTWFLAEIDGPGGSPLERLRRIGPALKQWFGRDDFYGCPFINAVGESDKPDDRLRALAIAHKTIVLERIAALCAEAGCGNRPRWHTRSVSSSTAPSWPPWSPATPRSPTGRAGRARSILSAARG